MPYDADSHLTPMPLLTADLPGTGGRIRGACEDFQVEEVPLYEPCGTGSHTYLWIEKHGIPTMEFVHRLATTLGRNARDIGVAGLKDARAVTRQWVSVEHVPPEEIENLAGDGWRVLEARLHGNKLRIGHLKGNRFRILIRDACEEAEPRARAVVARLVAEGVPNQFGRQRFGMRSDSHLVGRAVLLGHGQEVCDRLLGGPRESDPRGGRKFRTLYDAGNFRGARSALPRGHREHAAVLDMLIRTKGDVRRAARAIPKNMKRFFISAWQSALFNAVLARRMPELGKLIDGDLAWLHDRGAVFHVTDSAAEQERADRFEVSPTGPIFGYRMTSPDGDPGRIEGDVLAEADMTPESFRHDREKVKGGRRPLRTPLASVGVEAANEGLWIQFQLPSGCYATTVLEEIMKLESI